eukprot:g8253.t1
MEASSEGERLAFPFVNKIYDISNAALFYAHNGLLDRAQEQLTAGSELMSSELKGVDDAGSRDGLRQERVSGSLENLIKARAFVHFLQTGRLLPKSAVEAEVEDGEYLGAAMRLTAELSRYAITQASILDRSSVLACASLCRGIFGELVQFDLRNGPLRKKFDGVKYDVRKVDDILYELALLRGGNGQENQGHGGGGGEEEDRDDGGSRKRKEREEEAAGGEGGAVVLDVKDFEAIRVAMAAFDEKREAVIKRTRDIQKWSKMAIYSLHREDFKKAEKQLADCRAAAEGLLPLINETPRLRMGSFSCSMEEFAEARLYELWLREKRLATRAEIGLVNTEEYLGGLLDLTGELNRFAVARATERDSIGVKECLETVLVIHEFVTLNPLPGRLPKKKNELFNSLRKLQNMTYELALMKAGKGKVSGVSGLDDGPPAELHLARRGITHLTDEMEAFESLEVLWVNDNSLSRISNLDFNPTIKSLYAHNNRIGTLKGSLLGFTFLHTLTLGNNRIGNLQANLEILRLMRHLRYLELSGNPLAEETGYRLLVIKTLPWLETLDMYKITGEERSAARRTKVPKSWQATARESHGDSVRHKQDLAAKETKSEICEGSQSGSVGADVPSPAAAYADASRAQALLRKELSRMTAIVKQRRILLKEWFVAEDARREEVVTQSLFTKCLRLYGLWPSLGPGVSDDSLRNPNPPPAGNASGNASADGDFLAGKTGLIGGILLDAFRASAPRRAVALGRDPAYLEQSFVDYVKFCGAVEPKTGGRDLDNQRRVLDKAWKMKPKESTSKGHPLSGEGAPAGQQHLTRHPLSGRSLEGSDLGGGRGHTQSECARGDQAVALPTKAPMACEFTKSQTAGGPGQLDHWEMIELKRILEGQEGGGGGAESQTPTAKQLVTRAEAFVGLKKMLTRGRRPRVFVVEVALPSDEDSINNLSGSAHGGGGSSSTAATSDGSGPTNLDVLFDAAAALSSTTLSSAAGSGGGSGARTGAKATSGKSAGAGAGAGGKGQDAREPRADVRVLLRMLEEGVPLAGGVGPLEWDWLSCEEAAGRARKLYREAAHAQRRLLLISDGEDEAVRQEASRIRSKIATLAHNRRPRGGGIAFYSPSPRLGRVDVFLATDFHGGPFGQNEGGHDSNCRESHAASLGLAAASQSGCDVSLGSVSLAPTERGTTASGTAAVAAAAAGDRAMEGSHERPWFSKRVLTAG